MTFARDFRSRLMVLGAVAAVLSSAGAQAEPPAAAPADSTAKTAAKVDATTLRKKVMTGYQGWFRCAGDASGGGWRHWSRNGRRIASDTLTFEMWPDTSELSADERYPAGDFKHDDGSPAVLFSSVNPKTVERHFEWMQQYGIDGVFLQRFLVEVGGSSLDKVLANVRAASAKTGRVWAICYDMSGMREDRLYERLTADWKKLVAEQKITADANYLHHNGKPVVFVWGFFSDRFKPELAHKIIDFFQDEQKTTLIGGCNWPWRGEKNAEWARAYRRFDVISPWNVGHVTVEGRGERGVKYANTGPWRDDLAEVKKAGREYLPVIYPGFGWTNLKGKDAERQTIPRLGGEFLWRQFVTASEMGLDMAYVAMFDEVDEATAIFKVTNSPPTQAKFATYDGLPADWYLRLTGEGTKLLRGERKATKELPIKP